VNLWPGEEVPVEDYFRMQGRFRPLCDEPELLGRVKAYIDEQWATLVRRHERTHPAGGAAPVPA
jgi:hypothetical protein